MMKRKKADRSLFNILSPSLADRMPVSDHICPFLSYMSLQLTDSLRTPEYQLRDKVTAELYVSKMIVSFVTYPRTRGQS